MNGLVKVANAPLIPAMLLVLFVGCGGGTNDGTTGPAPTSVPATTVARMAEATRDVPRVTAIPAATAAPAGAASPASASVPATTVARRAEATRDVPRVTAIPAATTAPAGAAGADGSAATAMLEATPALTAVSEEADSDSVSEDKPYQPVSLSAGEVDDNERWDEYLEYIKEYQGPDVHKVDVSERHIITVRDNRGRPVPNAQVRVAVGEASHFEGRTYANGQTLFFPRSLPVDEGAESFQVSAEKGGVSRSLDFARGEASDWELTLDTEASFVGGVPLDVLFLLDSTGSMADEIDRIKDTLLSIASRIADLPSQPDLRFGMVSYRDRGDEYVTRLFDFDSDVRRFLDAIRGVQADGGGDNPESLSEALHVAVQRPVWQTGDAIRLVFLLADAPPHLDYLQDYDYAIEMAEARSRGIKIFSVASSGLDVQGEYIFRQIAQHTMGRFIFILYGGPDGGLETPHNVDDYTIERLDDLIVRLVEEELAALTE